jgi:hypothetical protein
VELLEGLMGLQEWLLHLFCGMGVMVGVITAAAAAAVGLHEQDEPRG